jgi:hypothetical protein
VPPPSKAHDSTSERPAQDGRRAGACQQDTTSLQLQSKTASTLMTIPATRSYGCTEPVGRHLTAQQWGSALLNGAEQDHLTCARHAPVDWSCDRQMALRVPPLTPTLRWDFEPLAANTSGSARAPSSLLSSAVSFCQDDMDVQISLMSSARMDGFFRKQAGTSSLSMQT